MLNRRSFLATSAAVAAVPFLKAEDKKADPWGGFTVGVQTYTFRKFSLERTLKTCKDLGLTCAEVYRGHIPTNATAEAIAAYKKQCSDFGVDPISFGVERFTKNHDTNKKLFEFAKALGAKTLTADPDFDSFDSLDKLVEEYKIGIAIHPHGPGGDGKMHRWKDAAGIMEKVKDHHEKIGSCLDTGHLIRSAQLGFKFDLIEQIKIMGKRNIGFHLKDHDNKRKRDVPFGDPTGVLNVLEILKALKDQKFTGYIAVEYEANPDDPTEDLKICLNHFKDQLKKPAS
jgi:inosose dehydratase